MSDETSAEPRRRAGRVVRQLAAFLSDAWCPNARSPNACCPLDFRSPFELLVATIPSAQCTDEKVNEVTQSLFARYSTSVARSPRR